MQVRDSRPRRGSTGRSGRANGGAGRSLSRPTLAPLVLRGGGAGRRFTIARGGYRSKVHGQWWCKLKFITANVGAVDIGCRLQGGGLQVEDSRLRGRGSAARRFTANVGAVDVGCRSRGVGAGRGFTVAGGGCRSKIQGRGGGVQVKGSWPMVVQVKVYHGQNWHRWCKLYVAGGGAGRRFTVVRGGYGSKVHGQ